MKILIISILSFLPLAGQTLPSAVPMPSSEVQFVDANGLPLAGGKLYTCMAGLSCPGNPQATYTDSTATVQNTNPIILDSAGRAQIWIGSQAYRLVLQDANGVQQWTQDNVEDTTLYFVNYVKTAGTATLISYTAPGPDTVQQTVAQKLANVVSVLDYGAKCDATTTDGSTGTDDLAAIQAALDDNPVSTIQFPNGAICKLSGTLLISSQTPLRRFGGVLDGNGVTLVWTNNGTSASTDANMPVGIGAYNRYADAANVASEFGGVAYVEIKNFNFNCPDYGACIFLGNSQQNHIHDNQFGRTLNQAVAANQLANFTNVCRYGIAVDGDFNDFLEHNYFACGRVAGIGVITAGTAASPVRVVYTTCTTGCSGHFNDFPHIIGNQLGNAGSCAILDTGTGSFTLREISGNYAAGQNWFYCSGGGIAADIHDNTTEGGLFGGELNMIGYFNPTLSGNIPVPPTSTGAALPRSTFTCVNTGPGECGGLEQFNIHNNHFSGEYLVFYSEMCCFGGNSGYVNIEHNRQGNPAPGAYWVKTTSDFHGTVRFGIDNYGFGTIGIADVFYPSSIQIETANPYTCYAHTISITGGGNWFTDGADTGYGPLAGTFQYLYFNDPIPSGALVTGIGIRTTTAFTASGLTSFTTSGVGDGAGSGPPPANSTWYSSASYDLMAPVSNTNHAESLVFKAPQDYTVSHPFVQVTANQNLNIGGLTGAFQMQICYVVPQPPPTPYVP
jgi:hypothetical protein